MLSRAYYFLNILRFVKNYIDTYENYQRDKSIRYRIYDNLQSLTIPNRPQKSISLDFIVKLPSLKDLLQYTEAKFDSILVIINRIIKIAYFISYNKSITADDLALLYFHYIFSYFGISKQVVLDRDSLFTSAFIRSLCKLIDIK